MSEMHVLDTVVARVRAVRARGGHPVVVLDLDHTLFDNGPRTRQILLEFAEETGRTGLYERLRGLRSRGLPYLLRDVLALVDERDEEVIEAAARWWLQRFFTDDYLRYDEPLPGAKDFCVELYEAGATLVYLSGRDSPNMLVGTAGSLRAHGFPVGLAHTVIILKPAFEMADFDFKRDVIEFIGELGEVVASFENEPGNCNLFKRAWPEAISVLLDTACAPDPPALADDVILLEDFTRPAPARR